MERLLIHQLLKWKESTHRKPLVLEGARQVGKTWLLREFGKKHFKDVCYINFEQKEQVGKHLCGRPFAPIHHRAAIHLSWKANQTTNHTHRI